MVLHGIILASLQGTPPSLLLDLWHGLMRYVLPLDPSGTELGICTDLPPPSLVMHTVYTSLLVIMPGVVISLI